MIQEVIKPLVEKKLLNNTGLPFWVFDVENVFIDQKRYLKICLFNRNFDNKPLQAIGIVHNNQKLISKQFKTIQKFNNDNVIEFYSLIEPTDERVDVVIKLEFVDNKQYSDNQDNFVANDPSDVVCHIKTLEQYLDAVDLYRKADSESLLKALEMFYQLDFEDSKEYLRKTVQALKK